MKIQFRHIALIAGILAVILSFFFFGREQSIYILVFFSGLLISLVAYLVILVKDRGRIILIWTLAVFAGVGIQWLTEPVMIRLSYVYFVSQHQDALSGVNHFFSSRPTNSTWAYDSSSWKLHGLSPEDGAFVRDAVGKTNVSFIKKDAAKIFYRTFGMLDVSIGIYYFYGPVPSDSRFRHVTGNWYY